MKRAQMFPLIATGAFWLFVVVSIAWSNGFMSRSLTIDWRDAWRATERIAWEPGVQRRIIRSVGSTRIPANQREHFFVVLPRGFTTGQLTIHTLGQPDAAARLIAENHQHGQEVSPLALTGSFTMDVRWAELVNTDKRFRFALDSGATPLDISSMRITATR